MVKQGMDVWPGDPGVEFKKVATISENGYNCTRLTMGAHTGTHVDSPHHVMHDDRGVDVYPMDSLVGWAEVLDLGELAPMADIRSADLDKFAGRVPQGARILLKTGWGKRWGQPGFYTEFPGLSEGAVAWLQARKVKLLGLEQPSVHTTLDKQVHKALLVSGMVLLETVGNMHEIVKDRVYLAALPMKLCGLDGAPSRVIAVEGIEVSE
jgi:kynurenine formamidase